MQNLDFFLKWGAEVFLKEGSILWDIFIWMYTLMSVSFNEFCQNCGPWALTRYGCVQS